MAIENEVANPIRGRKRILVTGAPRGGTTWAGQMIARAPGMGYVHEPFTTDNGVLCGFANPFTTKFQYITDENSYKFQKYLENLLKFKYPLWKNLTHADGMSNAAEMLWVFANFSMQRLKRNTAVMKDPLAIFSAPWLSRHFDMNVLVMIRHPAAFCSSLKTLNWTFDFNQFLVQPQIMRETRLADFEAEIRYFAENEQEIVLQGALLWNCIYAVVDEYRRDYPGWLFVKHEDLSMNPVGNFEKIYAELGLDFTTSVRTVIEESSGGQRPKSRITLNPFEQARDDGFSLRRNSKVDFLKWKTRLSDCEILTIKERTSDVSKLFYSDLEW